MLAAHEAGNANAPCSLEDEREQEQRHAVTIIGDGHKRLKACARSDHLLPRVKEVEPLIWRGNVVLKFQASPDGLGLGKVGKDLNGGDVARCRPCRGACRPAIDRGSHSHRNTRPQCPLKELLNFLFQPTFAKKCQQRVMTSESEGAESPATPVIWEILRSI
jgi:hypothetical protein